jgi:propanol-preferring alcohol dehydrogenase
MIGWRALKAAGPAPRLGLYGFGAAAHLVAQLAHSRGQECYAFVRPGRFCAGFARSLGVVAAR